MGSIGCPETSVTNYQSTLRNISEGRRPNVNRGGNLKSRKLWGKLYRVLPYPVTNAERFFKVRTEDTACVSVFPILLLHVSLAEKWSGCQRIWSHHYAECLFFSPQRAQLFYFIGCLHVTGRSFITGMIILDVVRCIRYIL